MAMRKILLIISIAFVLTGCALIKEHSNYVKTCLADPVCLEEAGKKTTSLKMMGYQLGNLIPIPGGGALAGSLLGLIGLAWGLDKGGKKKLKPENP